MARTYHVKVTAEDIAAGVHCDESMCPVALAVKRATGESDVTVNNEIVVNGSAALPPLEVDDFVADFDMGDDVSPFEFDLEL